MPGLPAFSLIGHLGITKAAVVIQHGEKKTTKNANWQTGILEKKKGAKYSEFEQVWPVIWFVWLELEI